MAAFSSCFDSSLACCICYSAFWAKILACSWAFWYSVWVWAIDCCAFFWVSSAYFLASKASLIFCSPSNFFSSAYFWSASAFLKASWFDLCLLRLYLCFLLLFELYLCLFLFLLNLLESSLVLLLLFLLQQLLPVPLDLSGGIVILFFDPLLLVLLVNQLKSLLLHILHLLFEDSFSLVGLLLFLLQFLVFLFDYVLNLV